ncbi:glycosyltransferase [Candidatus Pelagibacter sp.]|nr:glycosyltransferase [Candidatus Pelagibacter sp.]
MNILIYVHTKQNINKKINLGGIEILNYHLYNFLKKKFNVVLTSKILDKFKIIKWDIVISSNNAKIFNDMQAKRKILWLHNKLQIEKAFRKKQLFPILSNKIEAVFVSKYLNAKTSKLFNFDKRIVISNFLPEIFNKKKKNILNPKKPIFVWSVQRNKGLEEILNLWMTNIHPKHPNAEFHIFSIKKKNTNKFKKSKIFFHGRVSRNLLLNYYNKSYGMICLGYDETFCLNALESFSQGLPIISLGETALEELLINNFNGFKLKKINDFTHALNKMINLTNSQRNRLSTNCYQYSKKYNLTFIGKKWLKLINNKCV